MELEPRHEKAIELLACGVTVRKVAVACDVDERTVRRWKQDPEFALELLDALHESLDDNSRRVQPTVARAQSATDAVFARLTDLVEDDNPKIADRACRTLLSYGFKWATLPLQIQKEKDKLAQKELDRAARAQAKAARNPHNGAEKRTFANDEVQTPPALNPIPKVSGADISQVNADIKRESNTAPSPARPGATEQPTAVSSAAPCCEDSQPKVNPPVPPAKKDPETKNTPQPSASPKEEMIDMSRHPYFAGSKTTGPIWVPQSDAVYIVNGQYDQVKTKRPVH